MSAATLITTLHPLTMRYVWPSYCLAPSQTLWLRIRPIWPELSLGPLIGCAITDLHDDARRPLPGANRLSTICVSESLFLILWCIQDGADPDDRYTTSEIQNRWLAAINTLLRADCLLTNRHRYGRKALPRTLV